MYVSQHERKKLAKIFLQSKQIAITEREEIIRNLTGTNV